jgi:hypothetical protein
MFKIIYSHQYDINDNKKLTRNWNFRSQSHVQRHPLPALRRTSYNIRVWNSRALVGVNKGGRTREEAVWDDFFPAGSPPATAVSAIVVVTPKEKNHYLFLY